MQRPVGTRLSRGNGTASRAAGPVRSMVVREPRVIKTQTSRGTSSHAVISESSHPVGGPEVRRTLR